MTASILVATPHPPFGELLRISLEDSGQYQVRLVQSVKEARAASGRVSFQLAILDSSLTDEPFLPLCADLLRQQPGLRLVVIPPENNPNHPSLGGLLPHGYLSRPFYLPDLIATVARLLEERERELHPQDGAPAAPSGEHPLPPWLTEPLTLNAYLRKEIVATAAQAAIVGLNEPAQRAGVVRAHTGGLTDEAADEMAAAVFRYWDRGEKTDLMRYLRLAANKKDYLVYAAQITGDMALILAYDTSAPLSQIRPQTRHLAHTLATAAPEGFDTGTAAARPPAAPSEPIQPEPAPPVSPPTPAAHEPHTQPNLPAEDRRAPGHERAAMPLEGLPDLEDEEADLEGELLNLASLLGAIPSPDPGPARPELNNGWQAEEPAPPASDGSPTLPGWMDGWERMTEPEKSRPLPEQPEGPRPVAPSEPQPEKPVQAEPAAAKPAPPPVSPDAEDTQIIGSRKKAARPDDRTDRVDVAVDNAARPPVAPPSVNLPPVRPDQRSDFGIIEPPPDSLEDTRPGIISTINQLTQLEASPPSLSLLNYTCVLVPRMPGHYLTGELADRLSQWVAQLCLAFGWRLEGIAVRPEYLQWSVQVAPAVSPGNVVRILRQRTSQNIFQTYAGLADDNPSGDFWAPGYLIVSGPQPPSAQLLRDYIHRTRKRQGLAK